MARPVGLSKRSLEWMNRERTCSFHQPTTRRFVVEAPRRRRRRRGNPRAGGLYAGRGAAAVATARRGAAARGRLVAAAQGCRPRARRRVTGAGKERARGSPRGPRRGDCRAPAGGGGTARRPPDAAAFFRAHPDGGHRVGHEIPRDPLESRGADDLRFQSRRSSRPARVVHCAGGVSSAGGQGLARPAATDRRRAQLE